MLHQRILHVFLELGVIACVSEESEAKNTSFSVHLSLSDERITQRTRKSKVHTSEESLIMQVRIMSSEKHKASAPEVNVKKLKTGHWSNGLKASMHDPNLVVESDELVVVIKDKYPKAKKHFLILPKTEINSIKDLKKEHLSLLKYMHKKAEEISSRSENSDFKFRIGYHAVPSMRHLHLHVISQDFDSPCLKTKTHWNSFTTEYFVDSEKIMKEIEKNDKVNIMDPKAAKDVLAQPLRCHVCKCELKTIPKLKEHIKVHVHNT